MKYLGIFFFISISFNIFAQDDATVSQTTKRGKKVYKNNTFFTGTLYSDETANNRCKCLFEAEYLNGLLNGKKIEYHKNGKIKLLSFFKNGSLVEIKEKRNANGDEALIRQSINSQKILSYVLKLYPPDNYTEEFLRIYLRDLDANYENYSKNQFELQRRKKLALEEINKVLKELSFQTIHTSRKRTFLNKYSFEKQSFTLRADVFNIRNEKANLFSRTNMTSSKRRMSNDLLKINLVNSDSFSEINLKPEEAEKFKYKLKHNVFYCEYEYQILPKRNSSEYAKRHNYLDNGLMGKITSMRIYSDNNFKNLIHIVYPKKIIKGQSKTVIKKKNGTLQYDAKGYYFNIEITNIKTSEIIKKEIGYKSYPNGVITLTNGNYIVKTSFIGRENQEIKIKTHPVSINGNQLNLTIDNKANVTIRNERNQIIESSSYKTLKNKIETIGTTNSKSRK